MKKKKVKTLNKDEDVCGICGYDYETGEPIDDMIKHVEAGYAGWTEEGWCCTEFTLQAIQNVRKGKGKVKEHVLNAVQVITLQ